MFSSFLSHLSAFPPELATFIISAVPVLGMRVAVPLAVIGYHLPVWEAMLWGLLGDMVPVTIILIFGQKFHDYVQNKSGIFADAWIKKIAHVQKVFSGKYREYGIVGLGIFMSLPLPLSGGVTGALAAFIFGLPFRGSFLAILIGLIISTLLTLLAAVGVVRIF